MSGFRKSGTLTELHHKSHVPVVFEVESGKRSMEIVLSVTPERSRGALFDNLISIAVEGPAGFRGSRHNNPDRRIRIGSYAATPGFMAGPIEPGNWTVWLDVFRLLGPDPVEFDLSLAFSEEDEAIGEATRTPTPRSRGRAWYRGDLHAHSFHSDGAWSPADLADWAVLRKLDFATLTDHNTASGGQAFREAADGRFLALGGVELTTHHGHALQLGADGWREWRAETRPGITMGSLAARAAAAGETFVIAHPLAPGDPSCTGCRWEYVDVMPGPAGLVEVWNGVWSDYNEEGLTLALSWACDLWRDQRRTLAFTAGTDNHGRDGRGDADYGFNRVLAESLDVEAVFEAVRRGRSVLTSGPALFLSGEAEDGRHAIVGQSIAAHRVRLSLKWTGGAAGQVARLLVNGHPVEEAPAGDVGELTATTAAGIHVVSGELRASDGRLLAVSNPLYIEPVEPAA